MPKKEKVNLVSPLGIARYCYISQPYTQHVSKNNPDGVFKVSLEVDPREPEAKQFLAFLKVETSKVHKDGHPPYAPQEDEDRPKGLFLVKFKSTYKPKVFDCYGELIPDEVQVGVGSKIKVSYTPNTYDANAICPNGGMNLYLNAVQVFDLVEYKGGNAGNFGFTTEEKPADQGDEQPPPLTEGDGADDLPF